jgi:hypothetical protein
MLDDKRFEDAKAIFTKDVTVNTPGGSADGIEAALAQARANHTAVTQHFQTNVLIELDGDRAAARNHLRRSLIGPHCVATAWRRRTDRFAP